MIVRGKIGERFALNVPPAHISFRTHPMVLLGEKAQVEPYYGSIGVSANLDAG